MDEDILHMIRLSADVATERITHWFQFAVEEYPVEYYTYRSLKFTEIWQKSQPLFCDI